MDDFVKEINAALEAVDKKYPTGFAKFEKAALEEFDNTEVGTVKELAEKKAAYREKLHDKYVEMTKQARKEKNAVMDKFKEGIFDGSHAKKLPNGRKIFEKLYELAYQDGHAYGLRTIVNEYDDKEENFVELLEIMNEGK